MPLFEDTAEDEIRRLRAIIAKLEADKETRVVTVEIEPKKGFGYLFYITAPTVTSEAEFGLAMAETIRQAFCKMDVRMAQAVVGGEHVAPPSKTTSYSIDEASGSITCLRCGMTSYSPSDVREKYCGNCHRFHERG